MKNYASNNCDKAGLGSTNHTQQVVNKCSFVFPCPQEFLDSRTQTQLF